MNALQVVGAPLQKARLKLVTTFWNMFTHSTILHIMTVNSVFNAVLSWFEIETVHLLKYEVRVADVEVPKLQGMFI